MKSAPGRPPLSLVAVAVLVAGCSLIGQRAKPDPAADNVHCALEYLPGERASGPDLRFLAWSSPYREETFTMSLPDQLLHAALAPGRHLRSPLAVTGADCPGGPWGAGKRLPRLPSRKHAIRCLRRGLEAVSFDVETKWGSCSASLPAGDGAPRLLRWLTR